MRRMIRWGTGWGMLRPGLNGFLVLVLCLAACSESGGDRGTFVVRDSAGIQIAENGDPDDMALEIWSVSRDPELVLGAQNGDDPFLFARIRGALLLGRETVAVADGMSQEIRLFDLEGAHLRSVGGEGEGPGEFTRIRDMFRYRGDSIAAVDFTGGTTSIFSPRGEWVREMVPRPGSGDLTGLFVQGALDGGGFLMKAMGQFSTGGPVEGYHRNPSTFQIYLDDGEPGPVLMDLPDLEIETLLVDERWVSFPLEMGRRAESAVVGDEVVVGSTDQAEFFRFGAEGDLRGIIRLGVVPTPMTDEIRDAHIQDLIDDLQDPGEAPAVRQRFRGRIWPDSLPVFSDLESDSEGNLWIRVFDRGDRDDGSRWWVVGPDGSLRAQATLPAGFRVETITGEVVLGVATDALGVERIRMFRLVKEEVGHS